MTGTTDDRYLEWLYGLVASVRNRNPSRTYWQLFRQLYSKEFVWLVPNDDNRALDGKDLRSEYLEMSSDEVDQGWLNLECSMLEMLIALARRAAFEDSRSPVEWFGEFLKNLGLDSATDAEYDKHPVPYMGQQVDEILDRVIFRTYLPSGEGGVFPLKEVHDDQRHVELWYQLSAYLLDRF